MPEAFRALLVRHNIRWEGYTKPALWFREYILADHAQVAVYGTPRREVSSLGGEAQAGYREPPTWLTLTRDEKSALVVSDDPMLIWYAFG